MYIIKVLNQSHTNMNNANNVCMPQEYSMESIDDIAIFTSNAYEQIFGTKRSKASKSKKLISIVRITNNKNNE